MLINAWLKTVKLQLCNCYCALNPNENPAQFGIFFSANRLRILTSDFINSKLFRNRLYRKCSGRLYRSTGCGSPRWISDND
ncbi:MAG: hypothetical protein BECKG1743E_GA0114224_109491 [Candidatus Kentron sp. G]|nr:MAG: hypothetical protein BECKG1743E_GA0114224_109491 [Candidatus Kentron sp. G]